MSVESDQQNDEEEPLNEVPQVFRSEVLCVHRDGTPELHIYTTSGEYLLTLDITDGHDMNEVYDGN